MEFLLALWWFLALLGLAVAALPLAALLFPRAPRRGAAFALPVALATLGLAAYWLGHLAYTPVTLAASVGVLVAASLLARRRVTVQPRGLLAPTLVLLAAFALLVAVRATKPGIVPSGGEKFLDYALLNSILRADVLPPEDPWFAGRPVRYYYGGQLLAAVLTWLTDTPANYAYNLAVAAFYATLVTTAYGVAEAAADAHDIPRRLAGVLGAFLVGLAGNLATPVRKLLGFLPDALAREYAWFAFAAIRASPTDAIDSTTSHTAFHYWYSRYVVPETLNPFPLWAYYNGDLNAYMVSTPFLLLAAALALAYYRTPAGDVWRRRALLFGALPAVAGLLAVTSTWSLPTAAGLAWLALVFADAHPATLLPPRVAARLKPDAGRAVRELARTLAAGAVAGVVALLGAAWAAPYLLYHTPVNRGVGFLPPRSSLGPLLLVHGVFLGAFALYLAPRVAPELRQLDRRYLAAAVPPVAAALAWLAFRANAAAVAVFGPMLVAGWLLLRARRDVGFETLLAVAALGLALVVEFAYARVWPVDPNLPRWNTVYKVYMQIWVLWAPGVAVAVTRLLGAARESTGWLSWRRPNYAQLAAVAAVVLVAASATFPAFVLGARVDVLTDDSADLTLDGTRYVERYHPHEADAIDWLDARAGQPTMVSRPGRETYGWVNAPASLTGVPTLAGWRHEIGYRGRQAYQFRVRAVRIVYTGSAQSVRAVLQRHQVEFVYVGPVEREHYDVTDLSRIDGVSPAFANANVTIYRVNQTALAAQAAADTRNATTVTATPSRP